KSCREQQAQQPIKKKSTPARRIRQPGNTGHIKLPPSTNKPQSHTYKKLKQTSVNFQQLRDNQEDDLSSSTSSSSTFSSSSQQHSSVDYEAEDENEDKQRQRRHKDENDSLIHVQNFLKCFGANAYAGATVRGTTSTASMGTATTSKAATTSNTELRNWRRTYRTTTAAATTTATIITTTTATAATITAMQQATASTATATPQTQFTNCKPQKFQINTKFLRKPRNKLMKMLPTATTTATTTTTTQQQQVEQEQTQLYIDDSNAKFKDFSIDSLLNK
ncbi:uncharacterized protein LOC135437059, partial [Drosophila montana]|uniref:uncharacterized protein LOC135437059 n=1 Tax=Drosophila montana TaxID=40370 RepID=UPI00313D00C8